MIKRYEEKSIKEKRRGKKKTSDIIERTFTFGRHEQECDSSSTCLPFVQH
jgi:hypothetical protein